VLRNRGTDTLLTEARNHESSGPLPSRALTAGFIVAGLVGLSLGGELIVSSASSLAAGLGVPDVVIGSTIVAVGTSLPELATCIMAARQGQSDLALGNVVGSNIFNLLLVLGVTSCLAPVPVPLGGRIDLALMLGTAMVLGPISLSQARITRREGGLLLVSYAGFMVWQLMRPG
jgi:cation:H+ antiporter